MPLRQNGMDFLAVLVHWLADQLDTKVVSALAVVSSIEIVLPVDPLEIDLDKQIRKLCELPITIQEFRDALLVEKRLEPERVHLAPAGAEYDVQRLENRTLASLVAPNQNVQFGVEFEFERPESLEILQHQSLDCCH